MPTVLIAHGPNSVTIPCLVWNNRATAEKFAVDLIGYQPKDWYFSTGEVSGDEELTTERGVTFKVDKVVINYYSRCGCIGGFSLKDVEDGKPFIGWNLD